MIAGARSDPQDQMRGSGHRPTLKGVAVATVVILDTNDIHGHLTAWKGWEGDLKDKMIGGFGRLAGAVAQARNVAKDGPWSPGSASETQSRNNRPPRFSTDASPSTYRRRSSSGKTWNNPELITESTRSRSSCEPGKRS